MTDTEIRIAIAEACGWNPSPEPTTKHKDKSWGFNAVKPKWWFVHQLPNYPTDLNAMHGAETHLQGEKWAFYFGWLQRYGTATGVRATAHQRAEAFLRTIGKWKEEVK